MADSGRHQGSGYRVQHRTSYRKMRTRSDPSRIDGVRQVAAHTREPTTPRHGVDRARGPVPVELTRGSGPRGSIVSSPGSGVPSGATMAPIIRAPTSVTTTELCGEAQQVLHDDYTQAVHGADLPHRTLLLEADPRDELLRAAEHENVDLLVFGSCGTGSHLHAGHLGSVTHHLCITRLGPSSRFPPLACRHGRSVSSWASTGRPPAPERLRGAETRARDCSATSSWCMPQRQATNHSRVQTPRPGIRLLSTLQHVGDAPTRRRHPNPNIGCRE